VKLDGLVHRDALSHFQLGRVRSVGYLMKTSVVVLGLEGMVL
jgi:hypothetical protein